MYSAVPFPTDQDSGITARIYIHTYNRNHVTVNRGCSQSSVSFLVPFLQHQRSRPSQKDNLQHLRYWIRQIFFKVSNLALSLLLELIAKRKQISEKTAWYVRKPRKLQVQYGTTLTRTVFGTTAYRHRPEGRCFLPWAHFHLDRRGLILLTRDDEDCNARTPPNTKTHNLTPSFLLFKMPPKKQAVAQDDSRSEASSTKEKHTAGNGKNRRNVNALGASSSLKDVTSANTVNPSNNTTNGSQDSSVRYLPSWPAGPAVTDTTPRCSGRR